MADLKDRNGLFSLSFLASTRSQNGNFYFSYEFRAFWVNPKKYCSVCKIEQNIKLA